MQTRTKIVCTLGPASQDLRVIQSLGAAGMDVARLNFSHGAYEWHEKVLKRVRQASSRLDRSIAILQDLQGGKMRVGNLPSAGVMLRSGHAVVLSTDPEPAPGAIPIVLAGVEKYLKRGARVLLDDGALECRVRRVDGRRIQCEVIHGGVLHAHKGVNIPGVASPAHNLSTKNKVDIAWGVQAKVDFMAISFVRSAQDVLNVRRLLRSSAHGRAIRIVGKIEKQEAIDQFDAILPTLDAVLIGRGDLGVEIDAATVPVVQKQILARCRSAGVPAIVATQMLDSMQRNPRPTRAEVSDVANAVVDHADAVMLSGETASGNYPLESVRMMERTIRATEASAFDDVPGVAPSGTRCLPEFLGAAVRAASDALAHAPIITVTSTGRTARETSAFRPLAPIVALTSDPVVERQLGLNWGVESVLVPHTSLTSTARVITFLRKHKKLRAGTRAVVVRDSSTSGSTLEIIHIA
jgi:pyruvate kinase